MIQIEDYYLPIQVAEKIINGTKEVTASVLDKAICRALGNTNETIETVHRDMFDLEEIKEIADYLMVYYQAHQNSD